MRTSFSCASGLVACLLAAALPGLGQQAEVPAPPPPPAPTIQELRQNLALVREGTEMELGSLIEQTTRQTVAYLATHELSAAAADSLGLALSVRSADAAGLAVYTFAYASGGTRGTVHVPVMQWKNATGELFAYAPYEECEFGELYKLASPGRNLYLLLGHEPASQVCILCKAYVVELKGQYLLLDDAVFNKSPLLSLCGVPMTFNAGQQVLSLDLAGYQPDEHDPQPLAYWGYGGKAATKSLALKFSGGCFVKNK